MSEPDDRETWWEVQWQVPSENAIGGKAYWTMLEGGRFTNRDDATKAFDRVLLNDDGDYRLVVCVQEVVVVCAAEARKGCQRGRQAIAKARGAK